MTLRPLSPPSRKSPQSDDSIVACSSRSSSHGPVKLARFELSARTSARIVKGPDEVSGMAYWHERVGCTRCRCSRVGQ